MRDFEFVHNWEEATEIGRVYRLTTDEARYDLGDLARFVCSDRKNGRPLAGAEGKTLTAFAEAVGESRPVISALAAQAEFLPNDDDREACFAMGCGWHVQSAARIQTGWKPGQVVTEKQAALFWDIVHKQADGPVANERPSSESVVLERIRRESERLERIGQIADLPDEVYHSLGAARLALVPGMAALEELIHAEAVLANEMDDAQKDDAEQIQTVMA